MYDRRQQTTKKWLAGAMDIVQLYPWLVLARLRSVPLFCVIVRNKELYVSVLKIFKNSKKTLSACLVT